jgi:hypothetical protein
MCDQAPLAAIQMRRETGVDMGAGRRTEPAAVERLACTDFLDSPLDFGDFFKLFLRLFFKPILTRRLS